LHVPSQTLAEKSVSTVTSLETGRLKLSEETAYDIYRQSGVAMKWLLDSNPKEKPYTIDEVDGSKLPYTKELFERIQAHLKKGHHVHNESGPNTASGSVDCRRLDLSLHSS
jgi:hypothetical protein